MRVLKYFTITLALLIFTSISISYTKSYADQVPVIKNKKRAEVIKVFKQAIELNEDFKSTITKIPLAEQLEKREKLEKFNEEILCPHLSACVVLLSSGSDTTLAIQLFDLLISYQNSADEGLSDILGEIFQNNPKVIMETFKKFDKVNKKIIYRRYLEGGWVNVVSGRKIPESIFMDRKKKIEKIQDEIVSDEMKADFDAWLKDKVIIIPNGIDTQKNESR